MTSDRIEKQVLLRATLERVWHAVADAGQFGRWFGVAFDGHFVAGQSVTGRIRGTEVDPEVAKLQEPYAGAAFSFDVEAIEPMRRISLRWHPFATDPAVDYSSEPKTLIVFDLQPVADGVLLTITESGFDRIPLERRAKAFAANEGGWTHQVRLVAKFLEAA